MKFNQISHWKPFRQNVLYFKDVIKNPFELFVLLYINVLYKCFSIIKCQRKNILSKKKQRFDNVTFTMTLFCAKKNKFACWGQKNPKPWNSLKNSLIAFLNFIKPVIKNCCKNIWNIYSYIIFSRFALVFRCIKSCNGSKSVNLALTSNFQK